MEDTPISLRTKSLAIGYKYKGANIAIQENINLSLPQGQLISLLGINGIGKTTLLRTLAGEYTPLSGELYILDKSIKEYTREEIATKISVVLTEKVIVQNLTVYDLIRIGRTPHLKRNTLLREEDIKWIDKAIYYCQLEDLKGRNISELSDGQLQRVFIARAIAQNTPIILLDEPSNHLDFHHKVSLYKILKQLAREENKTILLSNHDIDLALKLSDQIIVLKERFSIQGKIKEVVQMNVFDNFFNDASISFCPEQLRFTLVE
ncbi:MULTISPECIES: ABC transporter ATP-binding protein [Myroides]|uniref:ATP-binding cassette domain-containing protein n=1 Tax=Myroides albus TaxID=2562892 RepID=A0A6I3LKB6_9FLAO|nr:MULTISPECIES: ABC transporter ATP-binding protein [Myroides]MTG98016.1 ATP-binding cassette domain-containing protein [Myroides albus]MVX35927.1 ATP-binding cassette domain-containing protein [Myroides sp. LoEW2-1]UVD80308.1 ABC transporter ATP-binding protein [Myroides albus]